MELIVCAGIACMGLTLVLLGAGQKQPQLVRAMVKRRYNSRRSN